MKAYDSFINPSKLDNFEEGIFSHNQDLDAPLTSREDAFANVLFNFDLWELDAQKFIDMSNKIKIVDVENDPEETNWDPQDL
ncbi:uncharacterized protein PGTG_02708 [Puccinia graminis f. sp. tritici CRL 75-36-700-3]|uniref:Uncharacterized protein n=1 Tax=Puccinia graminis f. sp. tritici (strain CRL 75-36-700-3 / race SCCL) TaxID=418459 RepID=E3JW42_PUCGT|nr:uncharacterized protein PGTG_02708 [Puccinia graminis f. sp. tritici CRL 75-36-700-3]EFP76267.2 hypothetical protein PGTG_02708 [Puccinia graminis f. sp. tritici CRL 75-36-700-3]